VKPRYFVMSAWLADSDPSVAFFARMTTRSPAVSVFETGLISVTGVLAGTTTFCVPPAY